jgi:hypothetical protein
MSPEFASLVAAVLGGLLVLAGQTIARRNEDRRHWRTLLSSAAAEVATAYAQERAQIWIDRSHEKQRSEADLTNYLIRQKALGQLRTLPGGGAFEAEIEAMSTAVTGMYRAYRSPDDQWVATRSQAKVAIEHFTAKVRVELGRSGR